MFIYKAGLCYKANLHIGKYVTDKFELRKIF